LIVDLCYIFQKPLGQKLNYHYRALGLDIVSPFPCPGFWAVEAATTGREITLELGEVPKNLARPICSRPLVQIDDGGTALFRVPGVARYLISGKSRITIDVAPAAVLGRALDYLAGTPLAILCLQHGLTPLAATALAKGDHAVLLGGQPSSGRSTMALTLAQEGFRLMADEFCVLDLDAAAGPMIWPSFPRVRIWPDTRAALNIEPPTSGGRLTLAVEGWFEPRPLPAIALAVMRVARGGAREQIIRRRGAARFESAMSLRHLTEIGKVLLGEPAQMSVMVRLANRLETFEFWAARDLARAGEQTRRFLAALPFPGSSAHKIAS
jgi:hypothetical protein